MKRICTICARGGSKGVANKNIRELLGRPLIGHTLAQARASGLFDLIAVSSDSEAILAAAKNEGADLTIRRPDELATDTAGKLPAIRHALLAAEAHAGYEADTAVDLDATSPLRNVADIRGAVALLEERGVKNVITGAPARRSPYFNMVERGADGVVRLVKPVAAGAVRRRQDAPVCFDMNASIYVWRRAALIGGGDTVFHDDTLLFEMPEERSHDIDTELDFEIVAFMAAKRGSLL